MGENEDYKNPKTNPFYVITTLFFRIGLQFSQTFENMLTLHQFLKKETQRIKAATDL